MSVKFNLKKAGLFSTEKLTNKAEVQEYIDNEVLTRCEPYVPKDTGNLINSGWRSTKIGSGNVVYGADYAAAMYYGISKSGNPIHYNNAPQRGSYWFERMKAENAKAILAGAAKICGAKAKPSNVNTVLGVRPEPVFNIKPKKTKSVKTVLGARHAPIFNVKGKGR